MADPKSKGQNIHLISMKCNSSEVRGETFEEVDLIGKKDWRMVFCEITKTSDKAGSIDSIIAQLQQKKIYSIEHVFKSEYTPKTISKLKVGIPLFKDPADRLKLPSQQWFNWVLTTEEWFNKVKERISKEKTLDDFDSDIYSRQLWEDDDLKIIVSVKAKEDGHKLGKSADGRTINIISVKYDIDNVQEGNFNAEESLICRRKWLLVYVGFTKNTSNQWPQSIVREINTRRGRHATHENSHPQYIAEPILRKESGIPLEIDLGNELYLRVPSKWALTTEDWLQSITNTVNVQGELDFNAICVFRQRLIEEIMSLNNDKRILYLTEEGTISRQMPHPEVEEMRAALQELTV